MKILSKETLKKVCGGEVLFNEWVISACDGDIVAGPKLEPLFGCLYQKPQSSANPLDMLDPGVTAPRAASVDIGATSEKKEIYENLGL